MDWLLKRFTPIVEDGFLVAAKVYRSMMSYLSRMTNLEIGRCPMASIEMENSSLKRGSFYMDCSLLLNKVPHLPRKSGSETSTSQSSVTTLNLRIQNVNAKPTPNARLTRIQRSQQQPSTNPRSNNQNPQPAQQ